MNLKDTSKQTKYLLETITINKFTFKANDSNIVIHHEIESCIPTVCVSAKGLPDYCTELTALRKFRDQYVSKSKKGKEFIKEYYRKSPEIITIINKRKDKMEVYSKLYNYLSFGINLIYKEKFNEAFSYYKELMNLLNRQYLQGVQPIK